MSAVKYLPFLSLLTLLSCGGGGEDSPSITPTPKVTIDYSITVMSDGYLENATVWLDLNDDGTLNSDEPQAKTNSNGQASLAISDQIVVSDFSVIAKVEQGITKNKNSDELVNKSFFLAAPKGEAIVSPLSTFIYFSQQNGIEKNIAVDSLALSLNTDNTLILSDFISTSDEVLSMLSKDIVRLSILPETNFKFHDVANNNDQLANDLAAYLSFQSQQDNGQKIIRNEGGNIDFDTDSDGVADEDDSDIDGDGYVNYLDVFPYLETENSDLDKDGVGDNSDTDIDGDGIANELDVNPLTIDILTQYNPGTLTLGTVKQVSIDKGEWHYFIIDTPAEAQLNVLLSQLTGDLDLYIKKSSIPTKFEYDCRSNNAETDSENCIERLYEAGQYYVAVFARDTSLYELLAKQEEIVVKKVMLLLHGLASEPGTWQSLISNDSFFNGACQILASTENISSLPKVNNQGISCFNVEFGSYDRLQEYASVGLDGKTCNRVGGCSGDYTTFDLLGAEVENVIGTIINTLGQDTEIVLLGHSRGGLAARAYLQNNSEYKSYVTGIATTGTPHQGSPLGRFYSYMEQNCIPESVYRQDGSKCEDNWEVVELLAGIRKFLGVPIGEEQMDLQAPSINFLAPTSFDMTELNENLQLLPELIVGHLSYKGTKFGLLGIDVKFYFDYDLYSYQSGLGDHPHPDTLRYIENGKSRASLIGDGIVPAYSQQLSILLEEIGRPVDVSGVINTTNILHTAETSRISDLNWLFERLYPKLGWDE